MPSFMDLQEANEYVFPIDMDPKSLKDSTNTQLELVIHPNTFPLPLPPSKKFLSNSLPNSANSSPRFGSNLSKKKLKNQNHQPSPLSNKPLARQHSVALANLERLKENKLRRSKSCGEGRSSAPPEEYGIMFNKVKSVKHGVHSKFNKLLIKSEGKADGVNKSCSGGDSVEDSYEEKFKCGAMCLFIPGLGKAKPVRARGVGNGDMEHGVSRNITAKTADRKSNESIHHARFSTSSPDSDSPKSCISTPRMRKAREDFNVFLEAQCA